MILDSLSTKSLKFLGIIFFSLYLPHSQGMEFIYEKTFTHDNSYCRFDGRTIEFEVRSYDQYTSMEDSEYGEFVVHKTMKGYTLLNMNNQGIGRYRLLKGTNAYCSKSLGIQVNNKEFSIFFAKENRPFGDTLTVLTFNLKSNAYKVMNTDIRVRNEQISDDSLLFQAGADPSLQETGKTLILNETFHYTKKGIEPFTRFDGKEFTVDRKRTFEFYGGETFFKNEEAFFNQKHQHQIIYFATNLERTKKCLSFDGQNWQCSK